MNTDTDTTVAILKAQVQEFCELRDWDQFHGAKDLAIGIITEASELLEHFRFKSESEVREMMGSAQQSKACQEELADVLFFLLRFAQMNGIDLSAALRDKIAKNSARYPVEKARGSNRKAGK